MSVIVVTADPRWAEQFKQVAADLATTLTGVQLEAIEHVGSTSVPGLAAKPTLDYRHPRR
ncbi:GrpB family protein [Dermatophilus congolensis]|uniref:GrpB family protein n=1 Tax=Dermatophilus congolensis TaxID=1863 RepID=UPI001FBA83FE|nr:GrpB family protein [Dermatophilus congolensis]